MDRQHDAPFSSLEALRFGWAKTRDNLRPFLLLGACNGFLSLLQQSLGAAQQAPGARPLLLVVLQLLQLAGTMLLMLFALRAHDGKPLLPDPLPDDMLSSYFTFALTSALYVVIVVFGFVLLIVPGVVWALRYCFATLLVVDRSLDPVAAVRESARLTRGVKLHLLGFALLMLGVNVLGAMTFGIGLLVTMPTTAVASVYALRRLQALRGSVDARRELEVMSADSRSTV